MPTKIRLQRRGKKGSAFYHIVIADGRAPRDGKFIESIGTYNPLTIPATIALDHDKALQWLKNGASPSETVEAILRYKGVLYHYHLLKGVTKGALTEEQAEEKFKKWMEEKTSKIQQKKNAIDINSKQDLKKRVEAEKKVNEEREKAIEAKKAKMAEKQSAKAEEATPENQEANTEA